MCIIFEFCTNPCSLATRKSLTGAFSNGSSCGVFQAPARVKAALDARGSLKKTATKGLSRMLA